MKTSGKISLPEDVRLLEGETVLRAAKISNGIYWKACAIFILALVLVIIFPAIQNLAFFLIFIAFMKFLYAYTTKKFLLCVLTNKRLILRSGIIRIDTIQINLDRVESVEIGRTIIGQVLGYADIVVTGTGSRISVIPYIDHPAQIRNDIEQQLHKARAGG